MEIPAELQSILLGDAAEPEEYHVTLSHKCELKKKRDVEGKWMCARAVNSQGLECLSKMKSNEDSINKSGWKCPKGEDCELEPNFVICQKCLLIDYLVEHLPDMPSDKIMEQIKTCKCSSQPI